MNPLTFSHFHFKAIEQFGRYMEDNGWFQWMAFSKFELGAPISHIFNSWGAYKKVGENVNKMIMLGDNKLRTDQDLVTNFGLSSSKGVKFDPNNPTESQKELELIKNAVEAREATGKAEKWRKEDLPSFYGQINKTGSDKIGVEAIPVVGSGSILSTAGWSPMLNDAFIMSGVHRGYNFYLALSPGQATLFNSVLASTDPAEANAKPMELWRKFMLADPTCLWEKGYPRVFLREIIGLAKFGYKPKFTKEQLGFLCTDESASDGASFAAYLETLKGLGFTRNEQKPLIEYVAKFLFGDSTALNSMIST